MSSQLWRVFASCVLATQAGADALAQDCFADLFPGRQFESISNTHRILVGDYNEDGAVDALILSPQSFDESGTATVAFLAGDSSGELASPLLSVIGMHSFDMDQGDFNRDGHIDLVVAVYGERATSPVGFRVLHGDGKGRFKAAVDVSAGVSPFKVGALDLNVDGILDVILEDAGDGETKSGGIVISLGRPDGTFAEPVSYALSYSPRAFAVGDFNEDGWPDIAVADQGQYPKFTSPGSVTLLIGSGDGAFIESERIVLSMLISDVHVADINNDRHLDLIISRSWFGPGLTILTGTGDGQFGDATDLILAGHGVEKARSADLNRDGLPDLVLAAEGCAPGDIGNCIVTILATAPGEFAPPTAFVAAESTFDFAMADLDRDDGTDLVAIGTGSRVTRLRGVGDGSFESVGFVLGDGQFRGIGVADFDQDGIKDLVTGNDSSYLVSIYRGDGARSFLAPLFTYAFQSAESLAVADFDHDGDADVVIASDGSLNGQVRALRNPGWGALVPLTGFPAGENPVSITLADFNHDGHLDVAVANRTEDVISVLFGNSQGAFGPRQTYPAGTHPIALATGDLDGDGDADLAAANFGQHPSSDSRISIHINRGDGTFALSDQSSLMIDEGHFAGVTLGDFDGDGDLDGAATFNSYTTSNPNGIILLINDGTGTFVMRTLTALPEYSGAFDIRSADLDGDRCLDLVVCIPGHDALLALKGHGNGQFDAPQWFAAGAPSILAVVEDLDDDMHVDVAAVAQWGVALFWNHGCSTDVANEADLNGDGAVGGSDVSLLLAAWGPCSSSTACHADLDNNGIVNGFDLALLLAAWG